MEIYDYDTLIENFLTNKIPLHEFEKKYMKKFQEQPAPLDEDLYQLLDWLFGRLDSYTDVEEARQKFPDHYITEAELRTFAGEALEELRVLKKRS